MYQSTPTTDNQDIFWHDWSILELWTSNLFPWEVSRMNCEPLIALNPLSFLITMHGSISCLSLPCSTSKYEYRSPSNSKSQKKMMYSVDVSNMILPWSEKYHHTTEMEIKWQSWISLTFHCREIPGKTPHGTLPKSPCLVYSELSDILIINFLLLLPLLPLCSFGHNFPFLVSNAKKLWTLFSSSQVRGSGTRKIHGKM